MSDNGPTAQEVARAVRYQNLERRVELENRSLYFEIEHQRKRRVGFGITVLLFLLIGIVIIVSIFDISWDFDKIALWSIAWVAVVLLSAFVIGTHIFEPGSSPQEILDNYEAMEHAKAKEREKETEMASKRINEEEYLGRGINVMTGDIGDNVNFVVGKNIVSQYSAIQTQDPELANAVATLIGYVEKQENTQGGEALENLVDEINGERKPGRLRAFWRDLVDALPDIVSLTSAAKTITKLF